MRIQVSRQSVAAGDDIEPHDEDVEVDEHAQLAEFIHDLAYESYLPSIGGGLATWVVMAGSGGRPLAVVAAQWKQPHLLVDPDTEVKDAGDELHFRYLAQRNPQKVLEQIRAARTDAELATALDPYGPTEFLYRPS